MTTANASTELITLELTVDKARLEQQMTDIFGTTGVGTGGGAGGGVQPVSGETGGKGIPVQPGAGFVKHLKSLGALSGIGLGITALIKTGKLMAGTLGALHSVMGAMLDSFIAPFMPIMAKGISWLAETGIPAMQAGGEKAFRIAETMAQSVGLGGTETQQRQAREDIGRNTLQFLMDPLKKTFEMFGMDKPSMLERATTSAAMWGITGAAIGSIIPGPGTAVGGVVGATMGAAAPFVGDALGAAGIPRRLQRTAFGALAGAGLGGAIGSIVPGPGTAVGALIGGGIGGAMGFFSGGGDGPDDTNPRSAAALTAARARRSANIQGQGGDRATVVVTTNVSLELSVAGTIDEAVELSLRKLEPQIRSSLERAGRAEQARMVQP